MKVYLCTDGLIIWQGERGIDKRITYQTYKLEDADYITNNLTIEEVVKILKDGLFEKEAKDDRIS